MYKMFVAFVAALVLVGCGVPMEVDRGRSEAGAVCLFGESRVCRLECPGATERAIGTQYCNREGEWEACVVERDCPSHQPADVAISEASDASPEAASDAAPEVAPLVELMISTERREYRRVASGRMDVSFANIAIRNVDPRIAEISVTVHIVPIDGSRFFGSRGGSYLSPVDSGYSVNESGMRFSLNLDPRNSESRISMRISDHEDAEGDFTTRDSAYRVSIQDVVLTFHDGLVTRSPSPSIRFPTGRDGGDVLIRAVEAPACGSNPMPEFLRQQMGNALEPSTAHLYEMDVRIYQRAGIISAGYMLLIQNEGGVFVGVANPMQVNLRTSTDPRALRMIDWMQCERRRGHLVSMRVRFMVPRGIQFALNGSVEIENVDDHLVSVLNTGGLRGTSFSSTCVYEGGAFQISRCVGDTCDDVLVLDELRSEVSDVSIRQALGMPLVDRACLYRSFLRR